jgi:hypothetical protein
VPGWIEAWRRRAACLWTIGHLFWRDGRAIEEFRSAVAPLVLFALMRLLAD